MCRSGNSAGARQRKPPMTISETTRIVRVRTAYTPDEVPACVSPSDQIDAVARCQRWRKAFRGCGVAYPATVLAIPSAATWVREHGCQVDAHSPQGIAFALAAGVPPARVILHCNGATGRTISDAIRLGVGQFIVDGARSAAMLAACADDPQHVVVDVTCNDGDELVAAAHAAEPLTVTGLYREAETVEDAVAPMFECMADARRRRGLLMRRIGVAVPGQQSRSPDLLAAAICDAVEDGCARFRLPRPAVTVFPDWIALTHGSA